MSERDRYVPSRDDLWRLPEVMQRTGLSQSSIYRHVAADCFPKPVHIGPRAITWVAGEVLDWIITRLRSTSSGRPTVPRKLQQPPRAPEAS